MKESSRNAWCDCIRGYAILLVCISHFFDLEPIGSWGKVIWYYFKGDTGVFMFYVLSGFLVTGLLEREITKPDRKFSNGHILRNFFLRRIFRLQPSYLLFLGLYFLLPKQEGALPWWALVLPISNWFAGPYITWHLKTLHVEETYYLFIGTLSALRERLLRPLMWIFLILAPCGRVLLHLLAKHGNQAAEWLGERFQPVEAFAVGGLLALYLPRIEISTAYRFISHRAALSFLIGMSVILLAGVLRPIKPFSYLLIFTWPLIFSVASAVMILSGLKKEGFVFAPEWLRQLGVMSYTVYLFQQFSLGPWQETFGIPFKWISWIGVVFVTAFLIPIWFRYVEEPLTRYGAKVFPRA
jgi:peptidoglycan/LPS O-acetylase OafA/YrhL